MKCEYRIGDCIEVLREYPDNHLDSCVTDPPYGLEFMGKEWDKFKNSGRGWRRRIKDESDDPNKNWGAFNRLSSHGPHLYVGSEAYYDFTFLWGTEVYRVLKPGAWLLAFGGTRTYHRMTCALEDVGFEIRDCMMWLYGSGFPKSLDVSKAIDKQLGAEREVVGLSPTLKGRKSDNNESFGQHIQNQSTNQYVDGYPITKPTTPEAVKWQGWGTALKPAYEPIVVARKPLDGTVAENTLKWGTGGINVDGCRIEVDPEVDDMLRTVERGKRVSQTWEKGSGFKNEKNLLTGVHPEGRWPSNVLLDEESAALLDEQSGESLSSGGRAQDQFRQDNLIYGHGQGRTLDGNPGLGDFGGASRFFYTAKASRGERERGVKGEKSPAPWAQDFGSFQKELNRQPVKNFHPTVKPLDLMQYLVRLVTPKDGICLDPFLGSGTTLLALRLEGLSGLGIEKNPEYEPIIKGRLEYIPPALETFAGQTGKVVE